MQFYVPRCWCARSPGTHIISQPVCQVWGTCLFVADSMFTSLYSATQCPPNLTTNPCLPQKTGCHFCTPAFYLAECWLSVFAARLLPRFLVFRILPELTSNFCALQQRRVEPRRCDLGGDTFHITKQANQITSVVDEVRASSLRHLAPRHSRPHQNAETRQRGAHAHTFPRLCAVRRQHILVVCCSQY